MPLTCGGPQACTTAKGKGQRVSPREPRVPQRAPDPASWSGATSGRRRPGRPPRPGPRPVRTPSGLTTSTSHEEALTTCMTNGTPEASPGQGDSHKQAQARTGPRSRPRQAARDCAWARLPCLTSATAPVLTGAEEGRPLRRPCHRTRGPCAHSGALLHGAPRSLVSREASTCSACTLCAHTRFTARNAMCLRAGPAAGPRQLADGQGRFAERWGPQRGQPGARRPVLARCSPARSERLGHRLQQGATTPHPQRTRPPWEGALNRKGVILEEGDGLRGKNSLPCTWQDAWAPTRRHPNIRGQRTLPAGRAEHPGAQL